MARQEYCKELTAEQMYQEDLLEHEYRTSGVQDYQKRAEIMRKTFDARSAIPVMEGATANSRPTQVTVFEA